MSSDFEQSLESLVEIQDRIALALERIAYVLESLTSMDADAPNFHIAVET